MKLRLGVATAYGLALTGWAYLDIRLYGSQGTAYDLLHKPVMAPALMLLAVLTGFVVGRWWAILILMGPVLSLGYLQDRGYQGPDGISPLTSPPSVFFLIWFGLLLLVGVAASHLWRHLKAERGRSLRSP